MPTTQTRNVNFGPRRTGATGSFGVGYALLQADGTVVSSRTTAGVFEPVSGSGIYAADISFPSTFNGTIVWDTGTFFSRSYVAAEEYNTFTVTLDSGSIAFLTEKIDDILDVVQSMTGSLELIRQMTTGRWKIEDNMMKFYDEDNITLVAQFDLYDENGAPTMGGVFERVKV